MTRVVVHIDRLVLSGFRRLDAQAIAEGLSAELTDRLGRTHALQKLAAFSDVRRLRPGAITIHQGGVSREIGTTAARSVVDELTR